jgi:hypothetical protein
MLTQEEQFQLYSEVKKVTIASTNVDKLVCSITQMSRDDVEREIMHFQGRFKLDFTTEYLHAQPLERLRHILYAAKAQQYGS